MTVTALMICTYTQGNCNEAVVCTLAPAFLLVAITKQRIVSTGTIGS
jgi:hypothetical protein